MTGISKLEDFWIDKIEKIQTEKLVLDFLMADFNWKRTLQSQRPYYSEISIYGEKIVREVYGKATANITPTPVDLTELLLDLPANDEGKSAIAEYTEIIQENLTYWEKETKKAREEGNLIREVFKEFFEKVLRYELKEDDAPESSEENDPKKYFHHLKNNVLKKRGLSKILKSERRLTNRLNQLSTKLQTILGTANLVNLPNGTTTLPNDWATKLVKKDDLDTANAKITILTTERDQYKTKADNYQRIHTKLNGKVSDSDLDTFINHTCPDCQLAKHNDYDAIKTERDQLKTDQTTQEQAKQQAIQAKETQIITKIITDLSLSTERERERESRIMKWLVLTVNFNPHCPDNHLHHEK